MESNEDPTIYKVSQTSTNTIVVESGTSGKADLETTIRVMPDWFTDRTAEETE